MPRTAEEAFWALLDKSGGPDACWPYKGRPNSDGYGYVNIKKVTWRVHRYAWTLVNGPIPEGMDLDHLCHTPDCQLGARCPHRLCGNPRHLRVATNAENLAPDRRWNPGAFRPGNQAARKYSGEGRLGGP